MKANLILYFFFATCLLVGCNQEEEQIEVSSNERTEKMVRYVDPNEPFYGIDITEAWTCYADENPNRGNEIRRRLMEDGQASVQVRVSNASYGNLPAYDARELGISPFVDYGWRIYLAGSGGERMYLTHTDFCSGTGYSRIYCSETCYDPYVCSWEISQSDNTYVFKFGSAELDYPYHLYVFIGTIYDWNGPYFSLEYRSFPISVSGPAEVISVGGLPVSDRLYPNMDLM